MADWHVLLEGDAGRDVVTFRDASVRIVDGALWIKYTKYGPHPRNMRPGYVRTGPMKPGPPRPSRGVDRETIFAAGAWTEAGTEAP